MVIEFGRAVECGSVTELGVWLAGVWAVSGERDGVLSGAVAPNKILSPGLKLLSLIYVTRKALGGSANVSKQRKALM